MRYELSEVLSDVDKVAIVGATPKKGKIGNIILSNIVSYGFNGEIYPVNPKYHEILGIRAYPTVSSIPSIPDAVIIAVPPESVPSVLREAEGKGIKLAVIITAGFGEIGNKDAQEAINEIIREGRIRVIGPNSAGISITRLKLHASIEVIPEKGSVGLAMQSGALGGVIVSRLRSLSSGISFFISIGNAADIGVEDVFEYASSDEETDAVIAYVEWIKDGRRFVNSGLKLSRRKPLCILKGGRGESSSRAVKSHTGGVASVYNVFRAAALKIGAYLADDVDDLVEVCEVLRRLGDKEVSRVLVVSNSGGLSIVTASQIENSGVEIPSIPPSLRKDIVGKAGKMYSGSNPLDFGGDSSIDQVIKSLTVEGIEKYFDLGVLVYVPTAAEKVSSMVRAFRDLYPYLRLPVIAYFDGEGASSVIREVSSRVPVVTVSRNIGKALSALRLRHRFLRCVNT